MDENEQVYPWDMPTREPRWMPYPEFPEDPGDCSAALDEEQD